MTAEWEAREAQAKDPAGAWFAHAQYWAHADNEGVDSELHREFAREGFFDGEDDPVARAILVVGAGIVDALRSISFAIRANGSGGAE